METNKEHARMVLQLALKNGLSLNKDTMQMNESGLDFLACFAEDEEGAPWVIRMPRRDDVIASADYEQRVLSLVKRKLPIAVPDWTIHTPELIAYPKLPGVPIATIDPETNQYRWEFDEHNLPDAFADSLAGVLAALHTIDSDAAVAEGIRVMNPTRARTDMKHRMDWVKQNYTISNGLWSRWQRWMADDSYWPDFSTVVHGDLHPGHLLVDVNGSVTGILDWTEGEFSDPSIDFQIYYALFGMEKLVGLLERYERSGGRVWPRMADQVAERYAAYPVLIALFAEKINSEEYRQMAQYRLNSED